MDTGTAEWIRCPVCGGKTLSNSWDDHMPPYFHVEYNEKKY